MSGYITSGTPYLTTSGRPIYKYFAHTLKVNPNRMKNGTVKTTISLGVGWPFTHNKLISTIIESPPEVTEETLGTEEQSIGTPVQQEIDTAIANYREWYNRVIGIDTAG